MRLGGPLFKKDLDPAAWAAEMTAQGYRAAYCPVPYTADDATVAAFAAEARRADIVIAEVGAWSNPLSPDNKTRSDALARCKGCLALAERIGARCAVNIAGSCGPKWDGPDARDLTPETFDRIVSCVREIIDAVRPARTFYTLETMPWMYPDSADSYLRLVKAIDRKALGVHFDAVNLVNCPQRYFDNARLIREFCEKLGPHIRSCHAKDIVLGQTLTTHLDECRPGAGALDYRVLLREVSRCNADMPLMIEHLKTEEEYRLAAAHIRSVAKEVEVAL